jgi:hypothetical protein
LTVERLDAAVHTELHDRVANSGHLAAACSSGEVPTRRCGRTGDDRTGMIGLAEPTGRDATAKNVVEIVRSISVPLVQNRRKAPRFRQ